MIIFEFFPVVTIVHTTYVKPIIGEYIDFVEVDDTEDVSDSIIYNSIPEPVPYKPSPKPVTKKDELLESLQYLNNKKSKTKQDRESIDIIKSILKNIK
jgi:signal peptidase I